MMEIQYNKDMYGCYMILQAGEDKEISYEMKMLFYNNITGLLEVELHIINNVSEFYYNITSKRALSAAIEKEQIKMEQLKNVMNGIFNAVEKGKELLLSEDNFILTPDCIFVESSGLEVSLCYYAGYHKDIIEQISKISEYLMNKVDYTDEAAVIMIYGLYKMSREENNKLDHLIQFVNKKEINEKKKLHSIGSGGLIGEQDQENDHKINSNFNNKETPKLIPRMQEKVKNSKEILIYSNVTKGCALLSVISVIILSILAFRTGILRDNTSDSIDPVRLFGFFLIMVTLEVYLLSRLLSKKNKVPKMQMKIDYLDPICKENYDRSRQNYKIKKQTKKYSEITELENFKINTSEREDRKRTESKKDKASLLFEKEKEDHEPANEVSEEEAEILDETDLLYEMIEEKTEFLYESDVQEKCWLRAENEEKYNNILIIEFPFFIGKLKTKVNCIINNSGISRFHAKLECINEKYYIMDLNSTNGTYVNDIRLKQNEVKEIYQNEKITFSDVVYYFEKVSV